MFHALDTDGDGIVDRRDLLAILDEAGLGSKDARLRDLFGRIAAHPTGELDSRDFLEIVGPAGRIVERVVRGELAVPDFADFRARVAKMYERARRNQSGKAADYIPPLADVDPEQFGVSVVTIDGQCLHVGDSDVDVSLQSACKPFNYCFALDELGERVVHRHVGMEPSGRPFGERVLMEDGTRRPHNPLVNAGAIMCAALIRNDVPVHLRFGEVRDRWAKLTGGARPRFNAWMAKEESRTGDNNRALAYMMKSAGVLPRGHDAVDHELRDALELYFNTCSLEMTTGELAMAAATLANGGVCPSTQERVLAHRSVRNCLSVMQMCGMYDGSGEFCFRIGLPAKSGVGGVVMLVVPRLMGICMWSPRLDAVGNSVRGVQVATELVDTYRLHVYDGVAGSDDRIDPRVPIARWRASQTSRALWAASRGDLRTLARLHEEHYDLAQGDYDARSPLHLAAAEGHVEALRFLLERGVDPNVRDRWGGHPLDDAREGGHPEAAVCLREHGAVGGDADHRRCAGSGDSIGSHGDADAVVELLWAAFEDDVDGLRRLLAQGLALSGADYDGRTALHLAAAEGRMAATRYLLAHGHPIDPRDRWGATPLDDALREGRHEVAALLREVTRPRPGVSGAKLDDAMAP